MKKSVIFLINGLGIEKKGSYSISIDQAMPNLSRTKETSYFTSAITSSLEPIGAYQQFFMGDTHSYELNYIKENVLNEKLSENPTYKSFANSVSREKSKLHIFVEPTNERVVNEINDLVNTLTLEKNKEVYLHLLLPQLTVNEYKKLINIVNYIKFHINDHITVGFIIGKNKLSEEPSNEELKEMKKLFFYCSAERWTETEKKLEDLKLKNIIPCKADGFTATNSCTIQNNDTILFFNTQRTNYDNIIYSIISNTQEVFKTDKSEIHFYSLISLYSKYSITSFINNLVYDKSLANLLSKSNKKALIITNQKNINTVNFYANGLNTIQNPRINFMLPNDNLYNKEYINSLIENTDYDLFIFDNYMDVSSNVNHLKDELAKLDIIIGNLSEVCVNKHSLFITSLYGLKATLPIASYNPEEVELNYEMEIPIFFFDYTYPRSKYGLYPGETNNILFSALKCIAQDLDIDTLIRPKGLFNGLFGKK